MIFDGSMVALPLWELLILKPQGIAMGWMQYYCLDKQQQDSGGSAWHDQLQF